MIDSKDISVVVQGAIDAQNTYFCLKSIRNVLPQAEIILSTWKGANVDGLDYDKLVMSDDPGSFPCDMGENSVPNNINRQIVSTKAGLQKAERKYSLKMRTDFILTSDKFLNHFKKGLNDKRDENFIFLKNKVVVCSEYSRNPRYKINVFRLPYCVSDFFYFGFSEDIKKIFDVELITSKEDKEYFRLHPEKQKECHYKKSLCRYMPEQYIWMALCKKHMTNLYLEHRDDDNKNAIKLSEKTIINNTIMKDRKNLSIISLKPDIFVKGGPANCYSENDIFMMHKYLVEKNLFFGLIYKTKIFVQNYIIKKKEKKIRYLRTNNLTKLNSIESDVVSFDIFDTLLFRRVDPNYVLQKTALYIELILKKYNPNVTANEVEFLRYKYTYENSIKCIANSCDIEYKFDDVIEKILEYYDISKEKRYELVQDITNAETSFEIDCMYPNAEAIVLLEKLKKQGKIMYAISDMYLKCDDIKKILKHFDLLKYFDDIYVSSEYNMTKWSTKLFRKISKLKNINLGSWTHIGDNYNADIIASCTIGINGIYYKNKKDLKRKKNLEKMSKKVALKSKYINQQLLVTRNKEKTFEAYIQNYFAFDFINFVYCVMIDAYKNNIPTILFLARDGNIFCEIWEKLYNKLSIFKNLQKIDLKIVKLKRIDTNCLSDIYNPYEIVMNSRINLNKFSIKFVIGTYGLSIQDFNKKEQDLINCNDVNLQFFINNYETIFLPKLKVRQEKIVKVLEQLGMFRENIAILDIGYQGTMQKSIMSYIKRNNIKTNIKAYYYGVGEGTKQIENNVFGYQYLPNLLYGLSFIEFLIKAYDNDGNKDLQKTYKYNFISRKVILDAVDDYSKFMDKNLFLPREVAPFTKRICTDFIHNPDYKFLEFIKNAKFSLDRFPNDSYINLFTKLKRRKDIKEQYYLAQYVEGSLKYSRFKSRFSWIILSKNLLSLLPYYISHKEVNRLNEKLYISENSDIKLF